MVINHATRTRFQTPRALAADRGEESPAREPLNHPQTWVRRSSGRYSGSHPLTLPSLRRDSVPASVLDRLSQSTTHPGHPHPYMHCPSPSNIFIRVSHLGAPRNKSGISDITVSNSRGVYHRVLSYISTGLPPRALHKYSKGQRATKWTNFTWVIIRKRA
jgi:hypothetical protein